ncbi:MAG TPA: hypothetical protein DCK97_12130 [Tistrella mobilis]|uniref:Uncharacterized protein n=1 Tax=Tistrella mobilis TaxID=171437 RepID=A0A3B9ILQ7_9PROT|nr:hypothetical protein [Tistrella mobilis]
MAVAAGAASGAGNPLGGRGCGRRRGRGPAPDDHPARGGSADPAAPSGPGGWCLGRGWPDRLSAQLGGRGRRAAGPVRSALSGMGCADRWRRATSAGAVSGQRSAV